MVLQKRLVACVKAVPVHSSFHWKGSIEDNEEVVLMMETIGEKFDDLEKEVRKIHEDDTFVLMSVDVERTSSGVVEWLKEELS